MNKPLYLFVGRSASGKTTVADILERSSKYIQTQSYTTRPPRYENEIGHIFINDEEFDKLENIVAYTEYNNYRYCATSEQIDIVDIYVVDIPGVETLLEKYCTERPIVVFYFDASVHARITRMIERHDSDMSIVSRLYNDEEFDWGDKLGKIVWHYKNNLGRNIELHSINANLDVDTVISQVVAYMTQYDQEEDGA